MSHALTCSHSAPISGVWERPRAVSIPGDLCGLRPSMSLLWALSSSHWGPKGWAVVPVSPAPGGSGSRLSSRRCGAGPRGAALAGEPAGGQQSHAEGGVGRPLCGPAEEPAASTGAEPQQEVQLDAEEGRAGEVSQARPGGLGGGRGVPQRGHLTWALAGFAFGRACSAASFHHRFAGWSRASCLLFPGLCLSRNHVSRVHPVGDSLRAQGDQTWLRPCCPWALGRRLRLPVPATDDPTGSSA